jgi:very-short-patch-repair endonuclease
VIEATPRRFFSRRVVGTQIAEQALADLLTSRPLRSHRLTRHCVVGPYVLDYVYCERALVVDLQTSDGPAGDARRAARQAFLAAMGYTVIVVSHAEVLHRPLSVLKRVRAALLQA